MDGTNDANLSDFISLRSDLLQGDFQLFYLTWLKEMTFYGEPDDEQEEDEDSKIHDVEPPVPPGLKNLSPALQNIVRVFDIDRIWFRQPLKPARTCAIHFLSIIVDRSAACREKNATLPDPSGRG